MEVTNRVVWGRGERRVNVAVEVNKWNFRRGGEGVS